MPKPKTMNICVRHVPAATVAALKVAAKAAGQSLQVYVLRLLLSHAE